MEVLWGRPRVRRLYFSESVAIVVNVFPEMLEYDKKTCTQ